MKHLFVPYELALLAKEKGFDEPCLGCYASFYESTSPYHYTEYKEEFNDYDVFVQSPLYQQLTDWFRDEHNISVDVINRHNNKEEWGFYLVNTILSEDNNLDFDSIKSYKSYYEALTAALTESFNLI